VLQQGGRALDAVEAAIICLENDPMFDAGTGSFLNKDGQVELDAGLMDGATLDAGAVAAVHRVRNPISLARHVLRSQDVLRRYLAARVSRLWVRWLLTNMEMLQRELRRVALRTSGLDGLGMYRSSVPVSMLTT
jgi:hypothetical protein